MDTKNLLDTIWNSTCIYERERITGIPYYEDDCFISLSDKEYISLTNDFWKSLSDKEKEKSLSHFSEL